jgi:hypothetical protein
MNARSWSNFFRIATDQERRPRVESGCLAADPTGH